MANEEHPCRNGLTEECFAAYPEWAKSAFAYRLLYTLYPGAITKLLPRELFRLRIGPDAQIPPGWIPPDGMIIPPGFVVDPEDLGYLALKPSSGNIFIDLFGTDWTPDDPLPDGIEIDTSGIFPPGWTPQDPAPDGVTISADAQFPAGWTPQDPTPSGITISPDAQFPAGWTPPDATPPGITISPDAQFPAAWTSTDPAPPGVTVSPGASFPDGWSPGDGLPLGVSLGPGASFPPGWSAGDPIPAGVTIAPGAAFPPGWNAGDPLPKGVTFRRVTSLPGVAANGELYPPTIPVPPVESFPPNWIVGDPVPPFLVVDMSAILAPGFSPAKDKTIIKFIWKQKTPEAPPGGPLAPSTLKPFDPGQGVVIIPEPPQPGYWFSDDFKTLDWGVWNPYLSVGGTADIVDERLRLFKYQASAHAGITRNDDRGGINPFRWSARINCVQPNIALELTFYGSTAELVILLYQGQTVYVEGSGDCSQVNVPDFSNGDHIWSVINHDRECMVFLDGEAICGLHTLGASWVFGRMTFDIKTSSSTGWVFISDFSIEQL